MCSSAYFEEQENIENDLWKNEHCSHSSTEEGSSSITHSLIRNASEPIIQAWKECVKTKKEASDLICYGKDTQCVG